MPDSEKGCVQVDAGWVTFEDVSPGIFCWDYLSQE
jgi:hypothetical protein